MGYLGPMNDLSKAGYEQPIRSPHVEVTVLNDSDFRDQINMSVQDALLTLQSLSAGAQNETVQYKAAAKILDYALELNATLKGEVRNVGGSTTILVSNSPEFREQLKQAAEQVTRNVVGSE